MLAVREGIACRVITSIAVVALFAGAVACGSDDDDGAAAAPPMSKDERDVRATVTAMQKDIESVDVESACAVMAPASKQRLKGFEDYPTCEAALRDFITDDDTGEPKPTSGSGVVRVASVDVKGRTAIANLVTDGERRPVLLRRSGGKWLVDLFAEPK